jgi:hypothetical protein
MRGVARGSQLELGMFVVAALLALFVGVSLGLLGGGGSILTVPMLRYVVGLEGHSAIATSLLVVGATSLAGLVAHALEGRVEWRTGLSFGASGMLGAYLAGRVAHRVPAAFLLVGFGLMMFATALAMLRAPRTTPAPTVSGQPSRRTPLAWVKIVSEGVIVGAVTGFVGAGGGFLVVPALVLLGNVPMEVAVGTSLLVIALKSWAALAGFLGNTPIDWPLALGITASAVVGSFGGGVLATRVSPPTLRKSFAWFVIAMAFFTLTREVPALLGQEVSFALAVFGGLVGTGAVAVVRRCVRHHAGDAARPGRPDSKAPESVAPAG